MVNRTYSNCYPTHLVFKFYNSSFNYIISSKFRKRNSCIIVLNKRKTSISTTYSNQKVKLWRYSYSIIFVNEIIVLANLNNDFNWFLWGFCDKRIFMIVIRFLSKLSIIECYCKIFPYFINDSLRFQESYLIKGHNGLSI